jgi:uncharacterized protein (DUF1697 family)
MYLALLRGVNVGGKNLVPMKQLAALLDSERCVDVKTYIQSGNIVFNAKKPVAAEQISALIEKQFGCKVPVVMRTSEEMAAVIRQNPFLAAGDPAEILHVSFLAAAPGEKDVAALDPNRSAPDEFRVIGREVYMKLPNGTADSKLTNAYFDSRLKTVSTIRNWRTVLKLGEMLGV